jgi:3-hydroxyacyl-[acyl-carrier-protein] dehydratase
MLKDTLYTVLLFDHAGGAMEASLSINKDHPVFAGHFPGQPVLPGACMLQLLKEVLEDGLKISIRLKKASQVKFLSIVDPGINNILVLNLTYILTSENILPVSASLLFGDEICFKFKGEFIKLVS